MASPYDKPPWSDAEKNFLLAELIKQASPPPAQLLNTWIHMNAPEVRWDNIPLPMGRTLHESMQTFEALRRSAGFPGMTVRTSALGPHTPSPLSAPVTLKRTFPFESYTGREIRPKPSSLAGAYGQPMAMEQPPKKKRGRPTKAEAAARAEASGPTSEPSTLRRAVSVGGSYPSPAAAVAPPTEPFLPRERPGTFSTDEARPLQPPVSRGAMPISSIVTPIGPKSTSQSSSSSGKRRRGRSTRSEPEDMPTAGMIGVGGGAYGSGGFPAYESPYARLPTSTPDTPARTASLRRRGDQGQGPPTISPLQPQRATQQPPYTAPEPPRSM